MTTLSTGKQRKAAIGLSFSLNPGVGEILDGRRQEDVSGDGVGHHGRLRLVVDVAHAAEAHVRHVQDLQEVVAL